MEKMVMYSQRSSRGTASRTWLERAGSFDTPCTMETRHFANRILKSHRQTRNWGQTAEPQTCYCRPTWPDAAVVRNEQQLVPHGSASPNAGYYRWQFSSETVLSCWRNCYWQLHGVRGQQSYSWNMAKVQQEILALDYKSCKTAGLVSRGLQKEINAIQKLWDKQSTTSYIWRRSGSMTSTRKWWKDHAKLIWASRLVQIWLDFQKSCVLQQINCIAKKAARKMRKWQLTFWIPELDCWNISSAALFGVQSFNGGWTQFSFFGVCNCAIHVWEWRTTKKV